MMINCYIKMIKYIFINIILKIHELKNLLINVLFLYETNVSIKIISDKNSFFINDY